MPLDLAKLARTTFYAVDAVKIAAAFAEGVRHVLRQIPEWVAASIRDGDTTGTMRTVIQDKAELAKILIRGPESDMPGWSSQTALRGMAAPTRACRRSPNRPVRSGFPREHHLAVAAHIARCCGIAVISLADGQNEVFLAFRAGWRPIGGA